MSRLTFAIPSKGRLKDNAEAWLARCGFRLAQRGGERGYIAELKGLPQADVLLLSAREIAEGLLDGRLHLGVTGEDLLHELSPDLDREAGVICKLGFGHARAVVAVPRGWLDVSSMSDLEAAAAQFRETHGRAMRVATKYLNLTRRFFATCSVGNYRIVESAGATEAAPAAGTAELIVDITTTGATLAANNLRILDDGIILESQAALAGSLKASWDEETLQALRKLLDSVEARARGEGLKRLRAGGEIPAELAASLGLSAVSGAFAHCAHSRVGEAAGALCRAGLGPVEVGDVEFVYEAENGIFETFVKKI